METRRFGRTGHMSTAAIFGGFALSNLSQEQADRVMEAVLLAGVNHIDVAPTYGHAEERLGPWLARERERFFLGCKTMERGREGATSELRRSLKRLQVEALDLYQIHAVTTFEELDQVTGPGGALRAILDARQQGLTRYIGITGHGLDAPDIFLEALRRFDFDTVLFPVNFVLYADADYRRSAETLIEACHKKDVGMMAIKAVARRPWGERAKAFNTWYEPFSDFEQIQKAVNFSLSQGVTGLCTAGDKDILSLMLRACEDYQPMERDEQEALIESAFQFESIF
jgi:aryl-alcohol dehydrogenase-like predicted oxidoreductase